MNRDLDGELALLEASRLQREAIEAARWRPTKRRAEADFPLANLADARYDVFTVGAGAVPRTQG